MMSLVISACLSVSPQDCKLVEIGSSNTKGYKACRIEMQHTVEIWQIAHPDLIVRSAFCMVGRSPEQS